MSIEYLSQFGTVVAAALALPALFVTWLALLKNSQPQVMVYYEPSRERQSIIELVIENSGNGCAYDVSFSTPIPIHCFGIEGPLADTDDEYVEQRIPALAPKQRYVYSGGQFGGLQEKLGDGLKLTTSYEYVTPIGTRWKGRDTAVLGVDHMKWLANHKSAENAIVDALSGTNRTTIRDIRDALNRIDKSFSQNTRAEPINNIDQHRSSWVTPLVSVVLLGVIARSIFRRASIDKNR